MQNDPEPIARVEANQFTQIISIHGPEGPPDRKMMARYVLRWLRENRDKVKPTPRQWMAMAWAFATWDTLGRNIFIRTEGSPQIITTPARCKTIRGFVPTACVFIGEKPEYTEWPVIPLEIVSQEERDREAAEAMKRDTTGWRFYNAQ